MAAKKVARPVIFRVVNFCYMKSLYSDTTFRVLSPNIIPSHYFLEFEIGIRYCKHLYYDLGLLTYFSDGQFSARVVEAIDIEILSSEENTIYLNCLECTVVEDSVVLKHNVSISIFLSFFKD